MRTCVVLLALLAGGGWTSGAAEVVQTDVCVYGGTPAGVM